MRKAIFTIVAKKYFGLAEVLGESVINNSKDVDFHIFISDEVNEPKILQKVKESKFQTWICKNNLGISDADWYNIAFKYSVTEFCTFLKPYNFNFLFNKGYDKVIYFDPDIYVFNNTESIFNELNNNFIFLTPHITTIQTEYTGDASQQDILASGIYNLGFLALKNCDEATKVLNWWQNRLWDQCFVDRADSLFTDQKWMDYIFSFFDNGIHVSRNLGFNLAPWNFFERSVLTINNELYVNNRLDKSIDASNLIFVHYSGFNYKSLADTNSNLPGVNFDKYPDIQILLKLYEEKISKSRTADFLNLNYTYNFFDNGVEILHLHRRLFRRMLLANRSNTINPFAVNQDLSFYNQLRKRKLVDIEYVKNNMDKMRKDDYGDYYKKVYYINKFFLLVKQLVGFKKYYMLSKFFIKYFRPENQYFLLDKKDVSKTL